MPFAMYNHLAMKNEAGSANKSLPRIVRGNIFSSAWFLGISMGIKKYPSLLTLFILTG